MNKPPNTVIIKLCVNMCHSAWFNEEAAWSIDGQDKVVGEPNKERWEEGRVRGWADREKQDGRTTCTGQRSITYGFTENVTDT